jgi:hypothetical protein
VADEKRGAATPAAGFGFLPRYEGPGVPRARVTEAVRPPKPPKPEGVDDV